MTRRRWAELGWALLAAGCAGPLARGPYPQLAPYEGWEIRRVRLDGTRVLPADSLRAVLRTRASRCRLVFLPVCIPGTRIGRQTNTLDRATVAADVGRLQLYHRDHGYYGTRVDVVVDSVGRRQVAVTFRVQPGDRVTLQALELAGTEALGPDSLVRPRLPLRVGEPFRRIGFLAAADTLEALLRRRGHALAQVLRNYTIDTIADVARARYEAVPGPIVRVGDVVVQGGERLGERTVRAQLAVRPGQVLQPEALEESQRNLYGLELVDVASVRLDSAALAPDWWARDTVAARVLVQVAEGARYVASATAGFGTIDCLRLEGTLADRNFLGGGRRLELTAGASRLGVGGPTDVGLRRNLCRPLQNEAFADAIGYRVAADIEQPRFVTRRTALGVRVYGEQLVELGAYLRQSVGTQVALTRDLRPLGVLTAGLRLENGFTRANPAVFCLVQSACTPQDFRELERRRWSNVLTMAASRDATRPVGAVLRGQQLRLSAAVSPGVLGSDNRFLNLAGEAAGYWPLGPPSRMLAARVQGGVFLQGELTPGPHYVPPEYRFYAGGPTTVRGFAPNGLGPTVYVDPNPTQVDGQLVPTDPRGVATGGTRFLVLNAELHLPSPTLKDVTRLVLFVDGGQVWAARTDLASAPLRWTPGAGLRVLTPVGPFRVDVAYNPYGRQAGPLYVVADEAGTLRLITRAYAPGAGPFLRRLRVQLGVGQAF